MWTVLISVSLTGMATLNLLQGETETGGTARDKIMVFGSKITKLLPPMW